MNCLPHSSSLPAAGWHGTRPSLFAARAAMRSAASMYFCATSVCTVRNSALLRKPSDSASGGSSLVAASMSAFTPSMPENRSLKVFLYSALLRRRSGAVPGLGVAQLAGPPLPGSEPVPGSLPVPGSGVVPGSAGPYSAGETPSESTVP
jgi:hypothetical protein